jgi:hypothetical protein
VAATDANPSEAQRRSSESGSFVGVPAACPRRGDQGSEDGVAKQHSWREKLLLGLAFGVIGVLIVPVGALASGTPNVTFVDTPPASTNQPNVTFTFTGGTSYSCDVDSAGFSACTSPLYLKALSEGQHTITVEQPDAGDAVPATYTWTEDFTPPDTNLTLSPATITNVATANFAFNSDDATATFLCSLNGATAQPCTSPVSYRGLSDGKRTFAVHAVDPAGNLDVAGQVVTWTVDTVPPQTTIVSGPSGLTKDSSAAFSLSSNKAGSTFLCSLDGASRTACSANPTFSALDDGTHTLTAFAVDDAGNVDPTGASASWTVKTSVAPPVITLSAETAAPGRTIVVSRKSPSATVAPKKKTTAKKTSKGKKKSKTKKTSVKKSKKATVRVDAAAPTHTDTLTSMGPVLLTHRAHITISDSDPDIDHYELYAAYPADIWAEAEIQGGSYTGGVEPEGGPVDEGPVAAGTSQITVTLQEGQECFYLVAVDKVGNQSLSNSVCATVPYGWPTVSSESSSNSTFGPLSDAVPSNFDYNGNHAGYWDSSFIYLFPSNSAAAWQTFWVDGQQGLNAYVGAFNFGLAAPEPNLTDVSRLEILATTCPICGTVQVALVPNDPDDNTPDPALSSPSYSVKLNLTSKTTVHQVLFNVFTGPPDHSTDFVAMRALSGTPQIEGLVVDSPTYDDVDYASDGIPLGGP